ncbi:MAG: Slp family lipoprotein [Thermodesulfovibrionales bacterium]|nr:Slp family lipoprotein [Thermodesulfovibrionales bacterium]
MSKQIIMIKNIIIVSFFCFALFSCATHVLSPNLVKNAHTNLPINELFENPLPYENRLFVFGGQIVDVKITQEGSLLEVVYIPVDYDGFPRGSKHPNTRIRALFKKEYGILDPIVYEKTRYVTIGGVFKGLQPGKIEELNYLFPFFHIEEIFLWNRPQKRYPYYNPWYDEYYPWGWGFGFGYHYRRY